MTEPKDKLPSKEGLREARKQLKDMYKKAPSDELIEIISQIDEENSGQSSNQDDIAVRGKNFNPKEVNI